MWMIRTVQGHLWHRLFGHPMQEISFDERHEHGFCRVVFTCGECRRSFVKEVCRLSGLKRKV